MSEKYDHQKIEAKWQERWREKKVFSVTNDVAEPRTFVLDMFPYPSGDGLHVGHPEGYTASDIVARYLRMTGKKVLHPMGWDAFGLPAENAAIKKKTHPRIVTEQNVANFKRQIQSIGFSYDWDREINTTDPKYYKWTQWIFLQLFKQGLAYEKEAPIWWCPKDKTGLANEEVVDGCCERCGTKVERKMLRQWVLKITDYAERLLSGLDKVDWPESIKALQRNWIGKSEGAEVEFRVHENKNFVLLHGFTGNPEEGFSPALKRELESAGHSVEVPKLPNTDNPSLMEQVEYVEKHCNLNANTVVMGTSFGGAVALKIVERLNNPVSKLVLVAGFASTKFKDHDRSFSTTFPKTFDWKKIRNNAENIVILHDNNDYAVTDEQTHELEQGLGVAAERVTANQPHFLSEDEPEILRRLSTTVSVFTTRPDTLFGATYLVLSPEHPLVDQITTTEQEKAVAKYKQQVASKSDLERTALEKEKTGVFTGAFAMNPANNEKIPIWIADYVLMSYGTGAIMAVPGHDERDFAFAKKFKLRIFRVIEPLYIAPQGGQNAIVPNKPFIKREAICAIIHDPKNDRYLCINWKTVLMHGLVTGGLEVGEDIIKATRREVQEETGYKNLRFVRDPDFAVQTQFHHLVKKENRWARFRYVFFELENDEKDQISNKEASLHEVVWKKADELAEYFTVFEAQFIVHFLQNSEYVHTGEGVLHNSGEFTDLHSDDARKKIVAWLEKEGKAKPKINYKLRDWIFSRQRYWGEPIPLVHCPTDGVVPIPEKDLPVLLPDVEKYEPTGTGESPLANVKEWVNTTCPKCGGPAQRETNTMPQWAGSCWYYLRFTDPHNDKEFASAKTMKAWLPVDLYVGGAEHAVLHLLYSRFWHKVLFDVGAIPKEVGDEPFMKLKNQGLILGPDGEKMSKSRGNVINPDEIIEQYGADTLRMYEMFMGPFEDAKPWDTNGIVGVRRFLDKVWRASERVNDSTSNNRWHKYAKQLTEGIENFRFNTGVSDLMKWVNEWGTEPVSREEFGVFLKLLSPFAPHIAEELWSQLGHKTLLAQETWPKFDPKKILSETVTIAVQVNGKHRANVIVPTGSNEKTVREAAEAEPNVKKYLSGEPKKVIYVKDRLINFVV